MAEIIPTLVITLFHLIHFILRIIFPLFNSTKPQGVPSIKNPLLTLSATALAKKIRNGELSSQTVVEAYIARIKEVNPLINAVVDNRFEAAVEDAKTCDAKLKSGEVTASSLQIGKPLYGVPVTVKESCSVKGLSYTGGTLYRKGLKATEDGGGVALLKSAGAIPLLVSNTSELCTSFHSFNYLFGDTVNPYDRRKTAGGSSGGEGALIAAGGSVLGIGSDLVGSVRIPAFFNGIFGHKPTPGIVPITGHFPMSKNSTFVKILTLGPLARYAEDLHLAMKVLSSKCERNLHLDDPVDMKKLRVFYLDNIESFCGVRATAPDIRRTVHEVAEYFSEKGALVKELSQDWVHDMHYIILALFGEVEFPNLLNLDNTKEKKRGIPEFLKSIVNLSAYTPTVSFAQTLIDTQCCMSSETSEYYKKRREELRFRINRLLKDDGILIFPTFHHEADFPKLVFFEPDCSVYSGFANMLHLPSTHVPIRLNENGLPIGIQITSASFQDYISLAVARELEKAFGGWTPPS